MNVRRNARFWAGMALATGLLLSYPTPALRAAPAMVPGYAGVQVLPVQEGDGKPQPKGAKNKEEAKRDAKSAPSKFKKGMRDMGHGIKRGFNDAKKDVKDPKHSKKKSAPASNGA